MVGDIDWGGGEGESAVDWGKEQQQQQGQHGAVEAAAADIDWAIEVEEAGADAAAEEASPHPAAAGASSGSAGVGMAGGGSLLADPGLRSELLNDLLELRAFLAQRHMELAAEEAEGGGVAFVGQYQGAHAGLQRQSLGAVGAFVLLVQRGVVSMALFV